jgi:hypothetical protein
LADEPAQRQWGKHFTETEATAFALCALIFRRGKTDGRYAIEIEELPGAMGLNPSDLQSALELAADRAWVEYVGLLLMLRAAGIYAAKTALDLPR